MKKLICVLVLCVVCSSLAFAGAPRPTGDRPYPVEETVATPPPVAPASTSGQPLILKKFGTWGLGLGGNPLYGYVEKDEIALYPQTEYGFTWVLGFGVTWFNGQPSAEKIRAAEAKVRANYNPLGKKSVATLVREELGVTQLTYTELGTAALIVPCNAEMGMMWIVGDNMRTRLGIGLPTLISFGVNWDF